VNTQPEPAAVQSPVSLADMPDLLTPQQFRDVMQIAERTYQLHRREGRYREIEVKLFGQVRFSKAKLQSLIANGGAARVFGTPRGPRRPSLVASR
jgi:hypothetical protein